MGLVLIAACSEADTLGRDAGGPMAGDDGGGTDGGLDGGAPALRADCSDVDADRASCCVGDATCCATGAPELTLSLRGCPDGQLDACVTDPDLAAFGATPPTIETEALVPGAGVNLSGVRLGRGLDPRGVNTELRATVDVPEDRCRRDCIDVAGIAYLDRIPEGSERASIRVGVLINGSMGQAQLIVSNDVQATFNLPVGADEVKLQTFIDGRVVLTLPPGPGRTTHQTVVDLPEQLYPAVIGRTVDPGPEGFITVREAGVTELPCDAPTAVARASAPARLASEAPDLGRPAVILSAGQRYVFYATDGDIAVATADVSTGELGDPEIALAADANDSFRDPWVFEHDGSLHLYVVHERPEGATLERATSGDTTFVADDLVPAIDLEMLTGITALDGPTVIAVDDTLTMVARATLAVGGDAFVAFTSTDGGESWDYLATPSGSVLHYPAREELFAFDRDEIAQPAIVFARGLYRLYYAGRRGTRWSVGLLVSPDLTRWYPAGRVLGPGEDGFDAIAVQGPAPFVEGDRVGLYYLASDGVQRSLGLAGPSGT